LSEVEPNATVFTAQFLGDLVPCHIIRFLAKVREARLFGIIAALVCLPASSLPHGKKDPVLLLNDLAARLLPSPLQVEPLTLEDQGLTLDVKVTAPTAPWPTCAQSATRMHSDYRRTLADLPWATLPVRLSLPVRRFFCDTPSCPRQTFTERVPTVARPYAHTTTRASQAQCDTGLVLGGAAGARQLARQGLPGSRQPLPRRIRAYQPAALPAPHVIGLDDWTYRTGHRYGTIVVDLERGCPVELLADRLAATVAAWLRAHPEVTVVARDRADAYAAGVTQGAPQAGQVADRWHVLKHLREAVEVELCQRPSLPWSPPRPETDTTPSGTPDTPTSEAPSALHTPDTPEAPPGPRADVARAARRAQRRAQYERARALRDEGSTWAVVAQQVGVPPRTLRHWFARAGFPARQRRTGDRSSLAPYRAYLRQRWEAGEHRATQLWHEVRAQGVRGEYRSVARVLAPWRQRQLGRRHGSATAVAPTPPAPPALTARQMASSLLRRPDKRTEAEQSQLLQVQQADPLLATLATHTEAFAQMVRERAAERLEAWFEGVLASPWRELKRFAQGLRQDYAAVKAALTWPYSNGPTEGHINRLKLFKRQMYGRAQLDLLRQRVLYAAGSMGWSISRTLAKNQIMWQDQHSAT
jgi:transposase